MKYVVDTNIILRFLVGDNKEQQRKAVSYFREGEKGKRDLIIAPLVIAEVCFVLETFYKKSREEIVSALQVFISSRWLAVEHRDRLIYLLPLYKSGLHFVDSLLVAWARLEKAKLLTFDRKLARKASMMELSS